MEAFWSLKLTDRIIMLSVVCILILILFKFALNDILGKVLTKFNKIKIKDVEFAQEEVHEAATQHSVITNKSSIEEKTESHIVCPRVSDILLLLEIQESMVAKKYEIASESTILKEQTIQAEISINGFITNILSELAFKLSSERYQEVSKDIELMKYRLMQNLVLVFRENHLAHMDEGPFLAHLKNRSQATTNTALLGLPRDHEFYSQYRVSDVMVLVVQTITRAREISIERRDKAHKLDEQYKSDKRKILEGTYNASI